MRKAFFLFLALSLCFAFTAPISTSSAEEKIVNLPILMYHSISTTKNGVYFVSPETLEKDLITLCERGYAFVTASAVKAYLRGEGTLPKKPLLLTFDDGHYDNLYYGLPLLEKYHSHAVINVIGCFSEYSSTHEKDHVEYSHLTWDEITYLAKSGVFEIGSHTYRMHAYKPRFGIKRMTGERDVDYRCALTADLDRIDHSLIEKCGVFPVAFAYPFGAYDKESEEIVKDHYDMIFTCYERINRLKKGDRAKLARLWRINRDGTSDTLSFFDRHGIV